MKIVLGLIVLSFGLLFSFCSNDYNKNTEVLKLNKLKKKSDYRRTQIDSICENGICLKIYSELIDESTKNDSVHSFKFACTEQRIGFSRNGVEILGKMPKMGTFPYTLDNGQIIDVLENEILYIGIVRGKKDFLFSLIGDGGCNACSEFYALYNKNGTLVYCDYFDSNSIFYQFGNLKKELAKIGAKETNLLLYEKINILTTN